MKKVLIKKNNIVEYSGQFETEIKSQEWIDYHVENNSWGKKAYIEIVPEVMDDAGNTLEPAKQINHEAEYTIEILDITQEVEFEKTKKEKKKKDREDRVLNLKNIVWKDVDTVGELKQIVKALVEESLKDEE